jgi:hypothetical protein
MNPLPVITTSDENNPNDLHVLSEHFSEMNSFHGLILTMYIMFQVGSKFCDQLLFSKLAYRFTSIPQYNKY